MNTLRIENLQENSVLDREALSMVDGGGLFNFVKRNARRAYNYLKKPGNRNRAWSYAKTGYKYGKKVFGWIF